MITEELLDNEEDYFLDVIALFREYPDYWWMEMESPDIRYLPVYPQIIALRGMARSKYGMLAACRGGGKTEEGDLKQIIHRCVFYPGSIEGIFAPTRELGVKIVKPAWISLEQNYPAMKNEYKIKYDNGQNFVVEFYNGSQFGVYASSVQGAGTTFTDASIEEYSRKEFEHEKFNAGIRGAVRGRRYALKKPLNGDVNRYHYYTNCSNVFSPVYAQYKFLYEKAKKGENVFLMGYDWRLLVKCGLRTFDYFEDLRYQLTPTQWLQECEGVFTGSNDGAIISEGTLHKNQRVEIAEFEADTTKEEARYIFGYDVAKSIYDENNAKHKARVEKEGALSALIIYKETKIPKNDKLNKYYVYYRDIVYIKVLQNINDLDQALYIKKMASKFNPYMIVVDYEGLGKGITERLTEDLNDGNPPYGCFNRPELTKHKTQYNILWAMIDRSKDDIINGINVSTKSQDMVTNFITMIQNGVVGFLIEQQKGLLAYKKKNGIRPDDISNDFVIQEPYVNTLLLFDEILNLKEKHTNRGLTVEQIHRLVGKDRYSAANYALYVSKIFEDAERDSYIEVENESLADFYARSKKSIEKKSIRERNGWERNMV